MPVDASIEFPAADARNIFAQMERKRRELGGTVRSALAWGGMNIMRSLAARTRQSKKLRPIIKRPRWDPDYKRSQGDARFGQYGVKRWDREGKRYFKPIYRTGEFGKLRFFDKKSVSWFKRDAADPKGRWEKIASGADPGNPEIVAPGIMTDKRRIIGRSGLARKTWRAAAARMNRGGTVKVHDVPEAASLRWRGGKDDPEVTITNNLKYVKKIMHPNALQGAMDAAADSMRHKITEKVAGRMGAK